MSFIDFNSSIRTFGNAKAIIMCNGEGIDSFNIPAPNEAEKNKDSLVTTKEEFEYNDIIYSIMINSSNIGTYIIIETDEDTDEINDFEIFIDNKKEYFNDEKIEDLEINLYVPTLAYTNTTSTVLFELTNKKVIPLLDIENEDKFASYLNDELIDMKHFLDISSMKEMTNKEQREDAKIARKNEKKELGKMVTNIPKPIEKFLKIDSKINHLKMIEKKELIIPVFKWEGKNANIQDFESFIRRLNNEYAEIALRVSEPSSFLLHIKEIVDIHDIHLIFDLNTNFNTPIIKDYIKEAAKYQFVNIIYLGAQFNTDDISIARDDANENIINSNQPLLVYESIVQDRAIEKEIGYGDYCGFDRKTITEMPSGGRGTARVVLSSLDSSMKLLIRRGWSEDDVTRDRNTGRTKLGYKHSMKKLLQDIAEGILDYDKHGSMFMNEKICDADISLKDFYPEITTPGIIKTLCFRHNAFSIIHNFIKI